MSGRRIIVHVGFPRCGSTLLQTSLFPRLGSDIRVVSPASADRRIVDFLIERFILCGRNTALQPVTADEKRKVGDILAEYPERSVLISCEGLVGDSFDNMLPLPHLARALRDLFDRPDIIVIVRRQSDLVKSYYRYAVEEGYYKSYPRFLNYDGGRFKGFRLQRYAGVNVDPTALDFERFVQCFDQEMGPDKVHVLPCEMIWNDYAAFCRRLGGVLASDIVVTQTKAPRVNPGLKGADLVLLRLFNRLWDTRLFGLALLPRQPMLDYLNGKCRSGSLLWRVARGMSARTAPLGLFAMLRPVLVPLLKVLPVKELDREHEIDRAIDAVMHDANDALNGRVGGLLTGLGYCDRR